MRLTLRDTTEAHCRRCGARLDEETDLAHDGYEGSPYAHNGRGSYGLSAHHFVWADLCESCRAACPACALEQEADDKEVDAEQFALAEWDDAGGMLVHCDAVRGGGYYLIGVLVGDACCHSVDTYYAWDDGRESRREYVELVSALRRYTPKACPCYFALHRQPSHALASELREKVAALGLKWENDKLPHNCMKVLQGQTQTQCTGEA